VGCPPSFEIVGGAGDVHERALDAPAAPQMYVAEAQLPMSYTSLLVRTRVPASAMAASVRRTVQAMDPSVAVWGVRAMDEILDEAAGGRRLIVRLLGAFAALALALAAVGVGGVMAYSVSERVREIAIRMALGARSRDVMAAVLRRAVRMTVLGVLLGLAGALAATRLMRALLFEVSATDPWILSGAAALLLAVAVAAAYVPARRAAGVDPLTALRAD
jgi:ABC-type antimicrobial peptide transport system permease subunit